MTSVLKQAGRLFTNAACNDECRTMHTLKNRRTFFMRFVLRLFSTPSEQLNVAVPVANRERHVAHQ